ncbi:MAG: hypothetical protein GVY15_01110 [Bacteroidetes bacterium]|nr:hypothetical protein [Bacteroidota bacterium]
MVDRAVQFDDEGTIAHRESESPVVLHGRQYIYRGGHGGSGQQEDALPAPILQKVHELLMSMSS